ncbi:hypothetical protein [Rhodococcoides fascians]|uniref:hypothetical protein n=1 Tax=Rhodococcoides fascians TaxID=1828 RepID=UPI0012D31A2E|nr:hypothetical protein [Rhodococcus fascians]
MSTTFEVEDDLSWDQVSLKSSTRTGRRHGKRFLAIDYAATEDLIDNYQFYRQVGWSVNRICKHLNVSEDTLRVTLSRAGISSAEETPDTPRLRAILERLIDSGESFISTTLPDGFDENTVKMLIVEASRAGRIARVGQRRSETGGVQYIWRGTAAIEKEQQA